MFQKKAKAESIKKQRKKKLDRVRPFLRSEPLGQTDAGAFDFLSPEVRQKFGVIDTDNVSAHGYDRYARELIESHSDGLVLDCGSGLRSEYLINVINYEIVAYLSTDIIGVAEELPFADNTFDVVLSLNVLEHVRNPFKAASELIRVLKPNANLYCVVPFLQPLHGYPNHYYNMTAAGLKNLFSDRLDIRDHFVYKSGKPIHALRWILQSWKDGLESEQTREKFLEMKVKDLLHDPYKQLEQDYVKELSKEKDFELACTTSLIARKKNA